jgi:acyl carrier protein
MTRDEILGKLRMVILDELYLEEVEESDLTPETPLFGKGLGLDSIDAVELVVVVEKYFNVSIKNAEEAKLAFVSLGVLTDFIKEHMVPTNG